MIGKTGRTMATAGMAWALASALAPPVPAAPTSQTDAPVAPPPMTGQPMAMVGIGGVASCAGFLSAVAAERHARPASVTDPNVFRTTYYGALMAWADGYITAKNEDELIHRLTGNTTTLEQRARWLELFCQANPEAGFFGAVYQLRQHLVADGL